MLFSCQKVIDIHPSTGEEKVIIQAYLYKDSVAQVVITKSTDYLAKTPPPHISNAVVTISDNHGNVERLQWSRFMEQFESVRIKGVIDDTYTVNVYLGGQSYSATSTLLYVDPIDSIEVVKKNFFGTDGYYIELFGTIPVTPDKYFLFKGYSNGQLMNGEYGIYYADNTMISGVVNGYQVGIETRPDETTLLEMYSITKPVYQFYEAANLQLNNDGGYFSTPPANVPSMFSNGAIGIFQCSDVQRLSTYVNPQ